MYATSTESTTSGSGRCAGAPERERGERRVRVVRLLRPRRAAPAFGFSLRGGREYGAGFFVSKVEFNSEAHLQGLKVGDQLVSVNGYRVDDAVHSELVHYLACQSRLKIKVRHVGMLPMKEKLHEPLSWTFVSERASIGSDVSSSPTLCHEDRTLTDLRLSILVPPRAKLGCGICKGPEWKPGIFVQFVREGGIAREAGLRPGDQIAACNGLDFTNVSFNEAVSAMKATGRLELVIREGAGTELVSPESSGYNSSASSAAGERSPAPAAPLVPLAPPAALRKRLASVAEEAADRADRLTMNRLKRRTWDSLDFEWKNSNIHNFDAPSDIEPDYDSPSIPNNPHTFESKNNDFRHKTKKDFVTSPSNRTIINLTEDGATIQCSYDNNQTPRKSTSAFTATNRNNEKKTIVVEVHHTSTATCGKTSCNFPPPPKIDASSNLSDISSVGSSATLSSAIAEEFQRRMLKKTNSTPDTNTAPPKKPSGPKPPGDDKKKQHDALMDEFKKVHRKMFACQDGENVNENNVSCANDAIPVDRQPTLPLTRPDNQPVQTLKRSDNQPIQTLKRPDNQTVQTLKRPDNQPTLPLKRPESETNGHGFNYQIHNLKRPESQPVQTLRRPSETNGNSVVKNDYVQPKREATDIPPPPPPMPTTNGHQNGNHKPIEHIKPTLADLKAPNFRKNGTLTRTPTPDYNNKNGSIKSKDDKAELDSLESYKLKNPSNIPPKPPQNYFVKAPNGTTTMKKLTRPVSVTIGEYAYAGAGRREPTKLEFLNGDKTDGPNPKLKDEDISNRLQSELVMTLSRSNLRKKTEALDRRVFDKSSKSVNRSYEHSDSIDQNFHARYGNNLLPLPPSISIPKVSKTLKNVIGS